MTIATNILDWSSDDNDDSSLDTPFLVELDPAPVVDQVYAVRVYASHADLYSVKVIGAGHTNSTNFTINNGISAEEESTISAGNLSTKYPVESITKIRTISGIYDQTTRAFIHTPGSIISRGAFKVVNGSASMIDQNKYADAIGSVFIDYTTTRYKKVNGFIAGVGTAFITGYRAENYQTIELTLESAVVAQTITVRECTTDDPIEGATVTFLGEDYTTDANGFVSLGIHESGQTIPIVINASGLAEYTGEIST